jgi:hypothetical protein
MGCRWNTVACWSRPHLPPLSIPTDRTGRHGPSRPTMAQNRNLSHGNHEYELMVISDDLILLIAIFTITCTKILRLSLWYTTWAEAATVSERHVNRWSQVCWLNLIRLTSLVVCAWIQCVPTLSIRHIRAGHGNVDVPPSLLFVPWSRSAGLYSRQAMW